MTVEMHHQDCVSKNRQMKSLGMYYKTVFGSCDVYMALQAFYPVDEEAAAICEAWKGVITNVPSQQQADQIQADPFGCSGLWELYQVQWQADPQVCPDPVHVHHTVGSTF